MRPARHGQTDKTEARITDHNQDDESNESNNGRGVNQTGEADAAKIHYGRERQDTGGQPRQLGGGQVQESLSISGSN